MGASSYLALAAWWVAATLGAGFFGGLGWFAAYYLLGRPF